MAMQLKAAADLPAWLSSDALHSSLWQPLSTAFSMQLGITCAVLFLGATAAGLLPLLIAFPDKQVGCLSFVHTTPGCPCLVRLVVLWFSAA